MPKELKPGTMLDEFQIKRVLGQGGFGITYLAYEQNLDRYVAIKEYFPREFAYRTSSQKIVPNSNDQDRADFDWGINQFVGEGRSLTRFRHKNVVGALRFIKTNGTAYLVMEHCEGESLESRAQQSGSIPEDELWPIVHQLLDGLEEVHLGQLLHLDIKPSNALIKPDGTVVLLDFGSARQAFSSHTKSVKVASAGYAAIEQESADIDSGKLGPWTDVYGLGATLYRLMTGQRPQQATARLLQDTLPTARALVGDRYGGALVDAVDAALGLRPQDRPQSIAAVRVILGANLSSSKTHAPSARSEVVENVQWLMSNIRGRPRHNLIDRAKDILFKPKETWSAIASEQMTPKDLILTYALPLAAIGPVASFIGGQLFGYSALFVNVQPGLLNGVMSAVLAVVMALVSVIVLSLIVDFLAPKFEGKADQSSAFKLSVYSMTAGWIGGIFGLVPSLSLMAVLAAMYGIYLFYLGCESLMKVPHQKSPSFTAVVLLCGLVVSLLVGFVLKNSVIFF